MAYVPIVLLASYSDGSTVEIEVENFNQKTKEEKMYEIEKVNNRYVVWRLVGKRKLRQGSYQNEEDAHKRIEISRQLMD